MLPFPILLATSYSHITPTPKSPELRYAHLFLTSFSYFIFFYVVVTCVLASLSLLDFKFLGTAMMIIIIIITTSNHHDLLPYSSFLQSI